MDAKLKRKWVKALRSGEFKQGYGHLYEGRTHCCLGVLARVQGAKPVKGCLKLNGEDVRKPTKSGGKQEYLLPQYSGGLRTKTQQRLGAMNDGDYAYQGKRKNFEQIADFIEKHL